jgi:hypothetical protein
METIAQNWERLLFYSGGALNLKKCSWSMLQWEWKQGRPTLYRRQAEDANISIITKSTGVPTTSVIQYNPPNQSTRILGVHLNPLGDFTDQLAILKKKSHQMSTRIKSSRISAENMHTFLRTMYAPAMLYALPAMAVDEEHLAPVQTSMTTTALQKMGASKTTPTEIRHGPLEMGGSTLIDLRTELGICNLKFLRNAIYTGSEARKLLLISLKYTQLEAGVPFNLLAKPHISIPYITPTWATSVRQFLYQHNITVNISDTLRIRYSNNFDRCIMDSETIKRYSPSQQKDINLVRLHLQVLTLSRSIYIRWICRPRTVSLWMSIHKSENSEPLAASVNANNISTTPLEEIYHLHIYQSWKEMEVPTRRSCSTASPNTFRNHT